MTNNLCYKLAVEEQSQGMQIGEQKCISNYGYNVTKAVLTPTERNGSLICPAFWDKILCWPDAIPGTLVTLQCPSHIRGFIPTANASRQCMGNGVWYLNEDNETWTNYSMCYVNGLVTTSVKNCMNNSNVSELILTYMPAIRTISVSGYLISLVTLLIAFSIMLVIRKLHCARNILHMHLFASFILEAAAYLFKYYIFQHGLGLSQDFAYIDGDVYFNTNIQTNNWRCKLITSIWQYFVNANYSWILMEGLYLHNLIFRALFADSNNRIRWYIVMGWGQPLIETAVWVIARLMYADNLCWTSNSDNYKIFLIIGVPTMISCLINFVFFARISMVLYVKLKSPVNENSERYKKWAKSTMVLVPLFGVYYAINLTLYYFHKSQPMVELIWLIGDIAFGSFQGCLVAILYCFLNGEVKGEVQPYITECLTFLATNQYTKYFFPFRQRFMREVAGRTSVCTTMSCSSLYTNGIFHRNSKTRLDSLPKGRVQSQYIFDYPVCVCCKNIKNVHYFYCEEDDSKFREHHCNGSNRTIYENARNSKSNRRCSHNEVQRNSHHCCLSGSLNIELAPLYLGQHNRGKCQSEPEINQNPVKATVTSF